MDTKCLIGVLQRHNHSDNASPVHEKVFINYLNYFKENIIIHIPSLSLS
jgi:hypothetical protein